MQHNDLVGLREKSTATSGLRKRPVRQSCLRAPPPPMHIPLPACQPPTTVLFPSTTSKNSARVRNCPDITSLNSLFGHGQRLKAMVKV